MAKDSSFDVVSKVDREEIAWTGELQIEIKANTEHRVTAGVEVFKEKCIKRQVPLKALQIGPLKETGGGGHKIVIDINQGISTEKGREIVKSLKGSGLKV